MNNLDLEGQKVIYEGTALILDETPDLDNNLAKDMFTAHCHDEYGNKYVLYWSAKEKYDEEGYFDGYYYDLNNPENLEELVHYDLWGGWSGVTDRWGEEADGQSELIWTLQKISKNDVAAIDKIVIYSDNIPDYFESVFGYYKSWKKEKREGKIILTAPDYKCFYEVRYVEDKGERELGRYNNKEVALKAAVRAANTNTPNVKYVDVDAWEGADAQHAEYAEFDENIVRLKVGVVYTTPYDDIEELINNNKVDYVCIAEEGNEDNFYALREVDEEKLLSTCNTKVKWKIFEEFPGARYYVGDDKTVVDHKWPGKTLRIIVKPKVFMKRITTTEEFVIDRSGYYNMKLICNLANVKYDRFRNFKALKVKLNEKELTDLKSAMKKVAKD